MYGRGVLLGIRELGKLRGGLGGRSAQGPGEVGLVEPSSHVVAVDTGIE